MIKIDEVINVLERDGYDFNTGGAKAMVGYTQSGMASALKVAEIYRNGGIKVENSLAGFDIDKNIEYMKDKGIESLIFFKDSVNIKYIRSEKEVGIVSADITVNDLVMPDREGKK